MRTLTLHIELFVHQCLLFRLYNLLCRTAQHAQPFVPKVNLIRTNIFMLKVLQKNNFSSNHNTSKNLITNIQKIFQNVSVKGVACIPPTAKLMNGFYAPSYKKKYKSLLFLVLYSIVCNIKSYYFLLKILRTLFTFLN